MQSQDHRTLDEIKADDIDQLDHAMREAKPHRFGDYNEAKRFQGLCVATAIAKIGGRNTLRMHPRMIDRIMQTKNIRVEKRPYHGPADDPDDAWRTGLYIYKMKDNDVDHDELAYFVSNLRTETTCDIMNILKKVQEFTVITNVNLGPGKIFSFGSMKPSNTLGRIIVPA